MRIIERPQISGEEWLLIKCDHCEQQFLLAPNEYQANGQVKCEFCPNICRREDIEDVSKENVDRFTDDMKEEQK